MKTTQQPTTTESSSYYISLGGGKFQTTSNKLIIGNPELPKGIEDY